MKLSRTVSGAGPRGGFTLIELMVVVSIIALLVALTTAAVMRAYSEGPKAAARTELGQLEGGVQTFNGDGGYKTGYLPSRIILRKYYGDYFNPATSTYWSILDQDSVNYITTMFKAAGQKLIPYWTTGIAWRFAWLDNVKYPPGGALSSELLEGDQCLVFFLGGIQSTDPVTGVNACLGFSTDAAHPDSNIKSNPNVDVKSFYEFKSNRLFQRAFYPLTNPINYRQFFSYADAYGTRTAPTVAMPNGPYLSPYAYFSSYGKNGYNRYDVNGNYAVWAGGKSNAVSECAGLGVWPYAETSTPTVRYLKNNTYQIVCSGADGQFGPGTDVSGATTAYFWTQGTAALIPQNGQDDQASFAPRLLKAGP